MGMFEDVFQGVGIVDGDISTKVLDDNGISPPAHVIRERDDWKVQADWYIEGLAAGFIGGTWKITVFAESIGPNDEKELGSETVDLDTVIPANRRDYTATIDVAAGTLTPGVYRLVTVLNYENLGVPQEMAGFSEGPLVQIYHV